MICVGIVLWHLFCLVFSKPHGSVGWCLTLIEGKFSVIIISIPEFLYDHVANLLLFLVTTGDCELNMYEATEHWL